MCNLRDTLKKKKSVNPSDHESEQDAMFRIYSILSYFVVLVVIGVPVWWYTTRVYRADLPLEEMANIELESKLAKQLGIPLSLEYDILITIVNPDPDGLELDVDGVDIDDNLQPFLEKLAPIADFAVKSQWLYLVELGVIPNRVNDELVLLEEQLPHIITPLEKNLGSHLSPRPCLNLVLYVPHCNSPLYIYNKDNMKSKTNSLLSPSWGGIYILNADELSCKNKYFKPDLQKVVSTFITHLQIMFKISDYNSESDLEKLKMRRIKDMIESSKRTQNSLAQLLSEINSIVIRDDVAKKINIGLLYANKAQLYLNAKETDIALESAKIAFNNSESAFSDPSLLALLYFPDDQKYAVYIPLFLPVMIPVLMSLTTVRKKYMSLKQNK